MNTKQRKRQRDIKTKLMAAICMLLVSSIMMVSTTYAWFTLSTAPEVTGINTAVGANGALEMALIPTDGDANKITSGVGDSMASNTAEVANVTWGNLVDLSNSAYYGLDKIQLMPAALNIATDGTNGYKLVVATEGDNHETIHLKTPSYGADGRVSELSANTVANGLATGATAVSVPGADNIVYGVRSVGTASAMTPRQLAYRNHRASASTNASNARTYAATALEANGAKIAGIAITHATATPEKYYDADLTALENVVTAVAGDGGSLDMIESALKSYILAAAASAANTQADAVVDAFIANAESQTLAQLMADTSVSSIVALIPGFNDAYTQYTGMVTKMTEAQTKIDELQSTTDATKVTTETIDGVATRVYSWAGISELLTYFANPNALKVNGMTADQIKADLNAFVNATTANGMRIDVIVPTGGGIFADIADLCTNYDAKILLVGIKYGSIGPVDMDAYMYATTTLPAARLNTVASKVSELGAPAAVASTNANITDMYGYVVDLAFRTNAANANLQLQTTAIDRIYQENRDNATGTMGGGSYMMFKGENGLSADQMKNLMDAINVVFYDPTNGHIFGIAKMDTANRISTADGTKAPLYLMNYTVTNVATGAITFGDKLAQNNTPANVTINVTAPAENNVTDGAFDILAVGPTGTTITGTTTANAGAYTFTVSGAPAGSTVTAKATVDMKDTDLVVSGADGSYSITIPASETALDTVTITVTQPPVYGDMISTMTALVQNVAKKVSVLVYLDGHLVQNDDVANGATSMTGTMNLQFSTDATLDPMQYTPLVSDNANVPETTGTQNNG